MSNVVEFPAADRPVTEEEIDKLHSEAFRDLESRICDCVSMGKIAAQAVMNLRTDDRELVFAVAHVSEMLTGHRHEAPAPIDEKVQPTAVGESFQAAAAVTRTRARGFGPCAALTPPVQASSPPLQLGGFFFWLCRTRRTVDPVFQADAYQARPVLQVAKIWRPTATPMIRFSMKALGRRSNTHGSRIASGLAKAGRGTRRGNPDTTGYCFPTASQSGFAGKQSGH